MFFRRSRLQERIDERKTVAYPVKGKAHAFTYVDSSNDTAAVLIHGFTGSAYDMREIGEFLFKHDIDIYGVRLRGHGTHIEDLVSTSHDDWVASVEELVREAEKKHKRIFLIGYSFGANIALDLAAKKPDRFQGVVCLGVSLSLRMGAFQQWYFKNLNRLLQRCGIRAWRKPYVPKHRVEEFESIGGYAYIPLTSMLEWKHFVDEHTAKQIENITTPILIIHSREDRISHPRSSQQLFESVKSAYKELFVLRELEHNPLRSENKDKIFTKVLQFIDA